MDRNLLFAVLLTTVIILLFSSPIYQKRFGRPQTAPASEQTVESKRQPEQAPAPAPSSPTATAPVKSESSITEKPVLTAAQQKPDTASVLTIEQVNPPAEREIVLENEVMKLTVSTRGGVITNVLMKKHTGASPAENAQLVTPGNTWCDGSISDDGATVQLTSVVFSPDSISVTNATLMAELTGGRKLTKILSLDPNGYRLDANIRIDGPWKDPQITWALHGAMNRTEQEYRQLRIWPFSMFMSDEMNMYDKIVYLGQGDRITETGGKKKEKRIYMREGGQNLQARPGGSGADTFTGDLDWYAVKNKYFIAALVPAENKRWNAAASYARDQKGNRFDFSIRKRVSDGAVGITLFAGPASYEQLKSFGHNLIQVMDLSWRFLRPIAILFLWTFRQLHVFIPNWGLVLILFSIIIKVVLYPLSKSSTNSMKKMSKLQPQIATLREKYKNEPQRLHKATMELYKQEGVNPFGGCLPILLQMPVFFALYPVVGRAFELRQAMFIPRWIEDLSRPDPYYILPVAMGISMYFQSKTTMTDPNQKPMLYMMPILMVILFANFSAGLTLYWLMFNLLSFAQQELIKS